MQRFEQTRLWQSTLAAQLDPDPEAEGRKRLRTSYESFRERARTLAAEISRDLPEFTIHDITHIDALWETAQLIAGDHFQLTPPEAFVLGGAFLVHDLGLALAAYPGGKAELRQQALWADTLAAHLRKILDRPLSNDDLRNPPDEVERRVTSVVLRDLHARRAESLALACWKDGSGVTFHLIEDPELRGTYARVTGLIAHSHWWPADQLAHKLPAELGAPGGFSNSWTVDPLKLACLLRAADACHLDERRAPGFIRALRNPSKDSDDHWIFQEKLYQPRMEGDRLVFTAKRPFPLEESSAWWVCYDALQNLGRELQHVDGLLADTQRSRLAARGVVYIDDPGRLARLIPTEGWTPIDTRIKVGAVVSLVRSLGGTELYGSNFSAPLRELIQNAADAVRARRIIEGFPSTWGEIHVAKLSTPEGIWIEVRDSGVGMSTDVLTGPFLDFGASYWGSELMHRELPGLEAAGFESTGKYGIGFFSVFMWGDRVQVLTRRFERAREDTSVLEFTDGLIRRPLLRQARADEYLREGGTTVRVLLRSDAILNKLLPEYDGYRPTLSQRCGRLCPALDVNLIVLDETEPPLRVVAANDWLTMDGSALLQRINTPSYRKREAEIKDSCDQVAANLEIIRDDYGRAIGRACLVLQDWKRDNSPRGTVAVGGFNASELTGIAGVLVGSSPTASRSVGIPLLDGDKMDKFLTLQSEAVCRLYSEEEQLSGVAATIRALGGETGNLPIARCEGGWVSARDVENMKGLPTRILLVSELSLSLYEKYSGAVKLNKGVFAVDNSIPGILQTDRHTEEWPPGRRRDWPKGTLMGQLMEAIAKAWGVESCATAENEDRSKKFSIGMAGDRPVDMEAEVLEKITN